MLRLVERLNECIEAEQAELHSTPDGVGKLYALRALNIIRRQALDQFLVVEHARVVYTAGGPSMDLARVEGGRDALARVVNLFADYYGVSDRYRFDDPNQGL